MNEIKAIQKIKEKCVKLGPFTSHSGLELTWSCDLLRIVNSFSDMVRHDLPRYFQFKNRLAGIELGGFLFVGAICINSDDCYDDCYDYFYN